MDDWELTVENIGCFVGKHSFLFKQGTNVVIGPNAIGKTSLLHAFQLLIPLDSNIIDTNILNSSSMIGHVRLQNGNDCFFIDIGRRSDGTVCVTRKKKLLTANEFAKQVIFLTESHEIMEAVIKGDFSILKDWFVRITDLNLYQKAYGACMRLDSRYRDQKDQESKQILKEKHRLRQEQKNMLSEIRKKKSVFKKYQLASIAKEFDSELVTKFRKISSELERINNELNKLKLDKNVLKTQLPKLTKDKENFQLKLSKIGENFESAKDHVQYHNNELQKIDSEIKQKKSVLNKINREISRCDILISNFINTLDENIIECLHCGSVISQIQLTQKLRTIEDEKIHFAEQKLELTNSISEFLNNRKKHEEQLQDIKVGLPKEEKELRKKIESTKNKINRQKKKLTELQKRIASKNEALDEIQLIFESLQGQVLEKSEKKSEIERMENELQGELKHMEKSLSRIQSDLTRTETQLLMLKTFDIKRKNLKKVIYFVQKGIKSIQENILDKINYHLNQIITELDIPFLSSIKLDDDFNLKIVRKTGVLGEFRELSGLEKRLIAILVGFSIKNALLQDFPFFIIDETLYSADDESFEQIINYIGQNIDLLIVTRLGTNPDIQKGVLNQQNIVYMENVA
ncbi:MAG: hypothetical protein ACFFB5_13965 [Promethearchaeota archaeon]